MFEHCKPEEAGVDSRGITRFLDDMKQKKLHMHAMMVLRHGKVIFDSSFEPWSMDKKHMLFSLSKSFTSTAVGFAAQDGLLSLSDRLVDFFPDLLTNPPCENMRLITVKHLLTMNTGHQSEPIRFSDNWEREFVRSYIEFEPGTHFLYNTFGTYMLSAIVQKVTGKKLVDYLREKLFEPLGMSEDIWSEESPTGVATGGYGLNVRVSDIAKLGQFYLQKGKWNGKQLLNEQWISDAQTPWSDNSPSGGDGDWGQGYGFQFWMCRPAKVFRGDGAFGQYCIICPIQDMVIAINSGVGDMGAVMQSIWDNILPAVGKADENAAAQTEPMGSFVTNAAWEDAGEEAAAPVPDEMWLGKYVFAKGSPTGVTALEIANGTACLYCGESKNALPLIKDAWQHVPLAVSNDESGYLSEVAVRAARTKDELILHLCYTKTPFEDVLRIRFTLHGARVKWQRNVGFGDNGEMEFFGIRV